jgi:hypothetical protein
MRAYLQLGSVKFVPGIIERTQLYSTVTINKIATTVHDLARPSNVILDRGSLARPARPRGASEDPLLHASTGLPALARLS